MKGEARLLLDKASDSLLLAIEKFNCPFERGRVTSVLISLDHAFEMLLKAAILHRGGRIRKRGASETLGFDACVRTGLSDGKVKFLTDEQAFTLQMLNGLRDAAQHHLITIQEAQLYIHAQRRHPNAEFGIRNAERVRHMRTAAETKRSLRNLGAVLHPTG